MVKLKRIIIYQYLYEILAVILPLVTTPIVTRNLGADGLGQYSYTYSIVVYFSIFAYLGMGNYGTREIARIKAKDDKESLCKTFWEIYTLQLFLSVVISISYVGYVILFVTKYKTLAILQILHLVATLTNVTWFYTGTEQFKVIVTRNAVIKLFSTIIIILFVKKPSDIYLYAITLLSSTVVCNLIMIGLLKKKLHFTKPCKNKVIQHLKPNLTLFIPVIASSIYTYMDKIMIGSIVGVVQTGYYEAMEKIVNVAIACVGALTSVMYPRISSMIMKNSTDKIVYYIRVSVMAVSCFSMVCIFGMAGVADIFVPIFFGEEFKVATLVVILGMFVLFPRGIRAVIQSEYLLPYGKDKAVIVAISSGAISNLIANIILIPLYGAIGAVMATIFSDLVACSVALMCTRKGICIKLMIVENFPYAVFGVIMFVFINRLKKILMMDEIFKLIVLIVSGGLVYVAMSVAYLAILKKTKKLLE